MQMMKRKTEWKMGQTKKNAIDKLIHASAM